MTKRIVELPAERLTVGMYVANLDRPWIETPFLFQGFTIASDEEVAELKRLCKVVYVEETAALAEAEKPPARKPIRIEPAPEQAPRTAAKPRQKDPVDLKTELFAAKEVHSQAKLVVSNLLDQLRRGRKANVAELSGAVDSMVQSVFRNREAITWLARMKTKDDYLYNHSLASSVWALVLGRHLGLDKDSLKVVGLGAMLLDVGKTRVVTELLRKPGKLTDEEVVEVRKHVQHSLEIIRESPGADPRMTAMVAAHHERFDGSGYPEALSGDAIPMLARIAGIVDCYDAMTSVRPYAKALSTYDAMRQLKGLAGSWFQAELVEQFIQAVGVFPTGTLVELSTGEVGVVIGQSQFRRLRPEVMLLLDSQKKLRAEFVTVDLQAHHDGSSDTPSVWITCGLEPGAYGIDPTEYFL